MAPVEFRLEEFARVSSTNDLVKDAIERGIAEGQAYRADIQSAGYGRYNRSWTSPIGGLYMSVLLRPEVHIGCYKVEAGIVDTSKTALSAEDLQRKLPTLSLIVGMAVREALCSIVQDVSSDAECASRVCDSIQIKWPNDLVVAQQMCSLEEVEEVPFARAQKSMFSKLSGISLEKHGCGICVGIGVNVFRPTDTSQSDSRNDDPGADDRAIDDQHGIVRNSPIYLEDMIPDLNAWDFGASVGKAGVVSVLAQRILEALESSYDRWLVNPFSYFVEEYADHAFLLGKTVRILNQDQSTEVLGRAIGVDDFGRLEILPTESSVPVAVASGEAHVSLL